MAVPLVNKKNKDRKGEIDALVADLKADLAKHNIVLKYDDDDSKRAGFKFAEYELKGVPLRLAIGFRDLDKGKVEIARRDTGVKELYDAENLGQTVRDLLDDIQQNIYNKALTFRDEHITKVDDFADFVKVLDTKGGFISAHWDGSKETEAAIKEATKATIRCIPLNNEQEDGACIFSGRPSKQRVLFARAY